MSKVWFRDSRCEIVDCDEKGKRYGTHCLCKEHHDFIYGVGNSGKNVNTRKAIRKV
jgi:hypothetical protein